MFSRDYWGMKFGYYPFDYWIGDGDIAPPAPAQPPAGGGGRIREQPLDEILPEKDWDEDEVIIFVH